MSHKKQSSGGADKKKSSEGASSAAVASHSSSVFDHEFDTGAKVEWKGHDGVKTGAIMFKITDTQYVGARLIMASKEHPSYVIDVPDRNAKSPDMVLPAQSLYPRGGLAQLAEGERASFEQKKEKRELKAAKTQATKAANQAAANDAALIKSPKVTPAKEEAEKKVATAPASKATAKISSK